MAATVGTVDAPPRPLLGLDVLAWRFHCLELAGYPVEAAVELAGRGDIDLHTAVALLESGCPAELAVSILT